MRCCFIAGLSPEALPHHDGPSHLRRCGSAVYHVWSPALPYLQPRGAIGVGLLLCQCIVRALRVRLSKIVRTHLYQACYLFQ